MHQACLSTQRWDLSLYHFRRERCFSDDSFLSDRLVFLLRRGEVWSFGEYFFLWIHNFNSFRNLRNMLILRTFLNYFFNFFEKFINMIIKQIHEKRSLMMDVIVFSSCSSSLKKSLEILLRYVEKARSRLIERVYFTSRYRNKDQLPAPSAEAKNCVKCRIGVSIP